MDEPCIFTDANGIDWDVSLDLLACRRVDASDFTAITQKEFTLLEPSRDLFMDVLTNTNLLFAIVWAIVQPQVKDKLGIDLQEEPTRYDEAEAKFISGINGKAKEEGRQAVWRSVAAFFPEHRTVLLTLMEQHQQANKKIGEEVANLAPEMTEMLNMEIKTGMDQLREDLRKELGKKSAG